jgi:cytochrome c553
MKKACGVLAGLLLATATATASTQLGEQKAAQACATCHGPVGISMMPNAPNLAGQPYPYLLEQLKHYQNGKRSHEIMNVIAKQLSEDEIDALARWYSSIRVEAYRP